MKPVDAQVLRETARRSVSELAALFAEFPDTPAARRRVEVMVYTLAGMIAELRALVAAPDNGPAVSPALYLDRQADDRPALYAVDREGVVLVLRDDGTSVLSDHVTLDEAARAFVDAVHGSAHARTFVGSDGATLVALHPDGTVTYGDGYTPDAATRAVWDAIGRAWAARTP